ncbi:MAG: sucrase ferredoxin [Ilumatobacteraceae bacterium]
MSGRANLFQCAMAARQRAEPLVATASQVPAWLLIEVAGAWGHDAIAESELGPFAPKVWREAMRRRGVRVIAIRRDLTTSTRHAHHRARLVHVVASRPGAARAVAHRRVIDLHDLVASTEPLATGHGVGAGWEPDFDRYVLVCTNGRHDSCCATFGRPLVRALRTSRWAPQVWECSHIGGDRFAANIVLLPDGFYFGGVDPAGAERLLAAHDGGRLDLACFRGRSTLRWPEQAAEHEVRSRLGLEALDAITAVRTLDAGRIEVDLTDSRSVLVGVERTDRPVPTPLTCKGKSGLSSPEWRVTSFEELPAS